MVQPQDLLEVSLRAAQRSAQKTQAVLREIPKTAVVRDVVGTARVFISAQERLSKRIRSMLRVAIATLFFGISGLVSFGASATSAFAKKSSPSSRTTHHHRISGVKKHHTLHYLSSRHKSKTRGLASWYGSEFDHKRTASGVPFDASALMAAHRTLPFGTKVLVTNLKNDKSCVVEITDRGPFSGHRIIDLSRAAAKSIGMLNSGTAQVELRVLSGADALPNLAAAEENIGIMVPAPVVDATSLPQHLAQLASTVNSNASSNRAK